MLKIFYTYHKNVYKSHLGSHLSFDEYHITSFGPTSEHIISWSMKKLVNYSSIYLIFYTVIYVRHTKSLTKNSSRIKRIILND